MRSLVLTALTVLTCAAATAPPAPAPPDAAAAPAPSTVGAPRGQPPPERLRLTDRPTPPPERIRLAFGMHVGRPLGLMGQVRLWKRHALVGMAAYDPPLRGLVLAADYRFTIWTFEFLRYDLTLGLWAGAGARVSLFEDHQAHRREWPVSFAPRLPMGVTVRLAPLPVELGFNVNPQVFDIYRLGLPRIRPEAGLELLVEFPSGY